MFGFFGNGNFGVIFPIEFKSWKNMTFEEKLFGIIYLIVFTIICLSLIIFMLTSSKKIDKAYNDAINNERSEILTDMWEEYDKEHPQVTENTSNKSEVKNQILDKYYEENRKEIIEYYETNYSTLNFIGYEYGFYDSPKYNYLDSVVVIIGWYNGNSRQYIACDSICWRNVEIKCIDDTLNKDTLSLTKGHEMMKIYNLKEVRFGKDNTLYYKSIDDLTEIYKNK